MTGKNIEGCFGKLFLKSEGMKDDVLDELELCETYFEQDRIRIDYKEKGERVKSKHVTMSKAHDMLAFYVLKHEAHEAI
jgi:hypothetical protein